MNQKPQAIAVLTEEEMQAFTSVQDRLRALDETANALIKAAMLELAEKRQALLTQHRLRWEAIEKKYALDPKKPYELVHSTREIVEHDCGFAHGAVVINLGELARNAAAVMAGASEATVKHDDLKGPIDKKSLN